MKKVLLTAACLFVASPAAAMTLTGISMAFYDAASPRNFTGYSTTATGSIDTTAATGHIVGNVPFFAGIWQADVMWASETPGANTWSGGVPSLTKVGGTYYELFDYNFNLTAGDIAVGLYFDSGDPYYDAIPVLAVFHPERDGTYSAVDQTWTDYYGNSGTGIQFSFLTGDWPAFSAVAVPEPASMLLIGAGLAGLVGVRRRKR